MGAIPVPTRLKVLRGNPHGKPIRPEPKPPLLLEPVPPPDYLNEIAAGEWQRMTKQLQNLQMLTSLDLPTLANYCTQFAITVEAQSLLKAAADADPVHKGLLVPARSRDSTGYIVNPLVALIRESSKEMFRYAAEFGCSPVARTRIAATGGDRPTSKFVGLIAAS